MSQSARKFSETAGLPPGTLVYIGEESEKPVRITLFDYDANRFQEKQLVNVEECFPFKESETVTWINIDGLHNVELIERLDAHFGLHPLVLEDILNTDQRPKMEDYGDYIFVTLKMFNVDHETKDIKPEQISLVLGSNYVITFQETPGDCFDPIRDRIRNYKGRVRKMGADYLAYCLIDSVVDDYFVILENIGTKIEEFEEQLSAEMTKDFPQRINRLKRNMIMLRKFIWPMREVIGGLQRIESKLIKKTTGIFVRDVYDHTIQVMDTIESYRDMVSGMHDVYLSSLSIRLNEIMKFLTIFTAIFSPINFLAGVYGMNFHHMPGLEWEWGYPLILVVMGILVSLLIIYFKRRKWL